MLISSFCFSLMQLCVKKLTHLPPTELVLFRSIVSLILCLAYFKSKKIYAFGNNKKFLILRGLFGVTALSLFFYTLQNLPMATAVTIQYLSPMFTALFAIYILKEPMKPIQWLYFLLAFIGIAIIKGVNNEVTITFLIAGIISAMFAGLAYNAIRKLKDTDHPVVVVFYFPLVSIPIMAVVSIFYWETPMGWDWLWIVLMGIFTQIAQVFMTKAWQTDVANKIASLKYIGIIFALSFDYFLFDESYTWMSFVGIALVLSGVILNILQKSVSKTSS